jgi:hypothetical protein
VLPLPDSDAIILLPFRQKGDTTERGVVVTAHHGREGKRNEVLPPEEAASTITNLTVSLR